MDWVEEYQKWKRFDGLDSGIRHQLNVYEKSLGELEDCFCEEIVFDQDGMCAEIGPGPNRINIYTIRKAAEGLARYMEAQSIYHRVRGVVIAYDSRFRSTEFALEVVKTLGIHGIPVYLFDRLRPAPLLAFAVRYLRAYAGVMITAGQHTPEYNGFKVFGPDGADLSDDDGRLLIDKVNQVKEQLAIKVADKDELLHLRLLTMLHDNEIERAYMMELRNVTHIEHESNNLCIVYTPLHGAGNSLVRNCFDTIGFTNVHVVVEQELGDPTFSAVTCLNPEEIEAYTLAIEYGERLDAAILLATDSDANQVGVAVKNSEETYQVLTKSEMTALLLHYSNERELTPVSSGEEFLQEKDAIQICMMLAEVAAYYQSKTMTIYQGLLDITEKSG